jgi:hypothetical protein
MSKNKYDPFTEFAKQIESTPKVSEVNVPVLKEDKVAGKDAPLPSPAVAETKKAVSREKKPALRDDHKAYTFYIRNDLLAKIRTASFKAQMSAKVIINQALDEYFEKHKGLL